MPLGVDLDGKTMPEDGPVVVRDLGDVAALVLRAERRIDELADVVSELASAMAVIVGPAPFPPEQTRDAERSLGGLVERAQRVAGVVDVVVPIHPNDEVVAEIVIERDGPYIDGDTMVDDRTRLSLTRNNVADLLDVLTACKTRGAPPPPYRDAAAALIERYADLWPLIDARNDPPDETVTPHD